MENESSPSPGRHVKMEISKLEIADESTPLPTPLQAPSSQNSSSLDPKEVESKLSFAPALMEDTASRLDSPAYEAFASSPPSPFQDTKLSLDTRKDVLKISFDQNITRMALEISASL